MAEEKKAVKVVYGEKAGGTKCEFIAKYTINSKYIDGNTYSVGRNWTLDEAYDQAVKAANALGKKYGVKPIILSKSELLANYKAQQAKKEIVGLAVEQVRKPSPTSKTNKITANPLVEKFGNAGQWRALIKSAAKHHGAEKVSEILKSGLEILEEILKSELEERKIVDGANRKMAEAILEARDAGVFMPSPTKEIESYVQAIIDSKVRAGKRQKSSGLYKLPNGEKWDGVGHPPAIFSKYLSENPDKTIDDLKIL